MTEFVRVAVPLRLRNLFDYRCPKSMLVTIGCRVRVPFGRQTQLGLVVDYVDNTSMPKDKVKEVAGVLDEEPVITAELMNTLAWVSEYYHQSLGEILWTALPAAIRKGLPYKPRMDIGYKLTDTGRELTADSFSRAQVQKKLFLALRSTQGVLTKNGLQHSGKSWKSALQAMQSKGWVSTQAVSGISERRSTNLIYDLTFDQQQALSNISGCLNQYKCFLLQGVTGSGKTEVYLRAAMKVIENGGQVLLLVPEIGLTPQVVGRIKDALGVDVFTYHSGMTSAERHRTWWFARSGEAQVIVGTRSVVFLSFAQLGLIVMDEEHDSSYKQQERARYHARVVALYRAKKCGIPIVLGSATPSLETVWAAKNERLTTLSLPHRATRVAMPKVRLIDLNQTNIKDGVAIPLFSAIEERLEKGEQSLIFLNRRGFAPVVVCGDCKWVAACENCEANLILHLADNLLHCHHCGAKYPVFEQCFECNSKNLHRLGQGTEKIESLLRNNFPGARVIRIDSDSAHTLKEIEAKLTRIQEGKADILVGTQMLSKGHHFPYVTLVGILNVDQGFFSIDFRAMEYMFQQILQVAGRAGRVEKPGEVIIQTVNPDSEYFERIFSHDYLSFANYELRVREEAGQPPYAHYALLRANSISPDGAFKFLIRAKSIGIRILRDNQFSDIDLLDAVHSPISRIAKRNRAQLLVSGERYYSLHRFLSAWMTILEKSSKKGQLRWNLDVDPIDFH